MVCMFRTFFLTENLVLFGEASERNINVMMDYVGIFCEISGQKVNLSKSSLFVSPNVHG